MDVVIVFILFIAFIVFIFYASETKKLADKKTEEAKKEAEDVSTAIFITEKERLLASKHRGLLENFITKCGSYPGFGKYYGYDNFCGDLIDSTTERIMPRVVSEEETELLTKLLNGKGFKLDRARAEDVLSELIDKQAYDEVKSKILANHPKNKRDFVENFLSLYGDDFIMTVGHIARDLLKENNIDCNPEDYEDLCKIVDEIKMSHLEKNLGSKALVSKL